MNDPEFLEPALRRLTPAALPAELRERIAATIRRPERPVSAPDDGLPLPAWLRWVFPLGATAVGATLLLLQSALCRVAEPTARHALLADEVIIGQTLVNAFETVARPPDGPPVRLRWEHWVDEWTLRDSTRGVAIEQSRPRWEVFPVGLELY